MKTRTLVIAISLILGLLCAMETSAVQRMDASQLVGGGCDCSGNTPTHNCNDPCQTQWYAADGTGSGTVTSYTFCTSGTGCSNDTKVESTYCDGN
jgi:hypothetical protein